MSRLRSLVRPFFGVVCAVWGIQEVAYISQLVMRDHNWMAHVSSIVLAFCAFVATFGLFAGKRWFFLTSIVVAVNQTIGGLIGVFSGRDVILRVLIAILGIGFLVWLRSVRPGHQVANA